MKLYSDGVTKITDPFYEIKCTTCGHSTWALLKRNKCSKCGAEIECNPAGPREILSGVH